MEKVMGLSQKNNRDLMKALRGWQSSGTGMELGDPGSEPLDDTPRTTPPQ